MLYSQKEKAFSKFDSFANAIYPIPCPWCLLFLAFCLARFDHKVGV